MARRPALATTPPTLAQYVASASWATALTAPFVYSLTVPLALLDLWATLYQHVCFRIYGIEPVRRRAYFVFDRHRLGYLNAVEKANCVYCAYANGVLAYVHEIAARTEQYWCPIKHRRAIRSAHERYRHFLEYGDEAGYRVHLSDLREALQPAPPRRRPTRRHRSAPLKGTVA